MSNRHGGSRHGSGRKLGGKNLRTIAATELVKEAQERFPAYNSIDWGEDNLKAIENGWILKGSSIAVLAEKIFHHPDNMKRMNADMLQQTVDRYNANCAAGADPDYERERETLGPVITPPFYALPLYPGGPNTKGGLLVNANRQVLDWEGNPIERLYAAGEIASVFQFVYQGGGNLAEGIVFGRLAGRLAAAEKQV